MSLELNVISYDSCISITSGDYMTIVTPDPSALAEIENHRFPVLLGSVEGDRLYVSKVKDVYRIYSHGGEIDIICINNTQFMNQLKGALIQLE